jgi:hypothetical protein
MQSTLSHPTKATSKPRLPLVLGVLTGPLTRHRSGNVDARLRVDCPFCGELHTHGWRLGGGIRVEQRVSHCGRGEYQIRPERRATR